MNADEPHDLGSEIGGQLLDAITLLALGIAAVTLVAHASHYFFLYDDFALVREATDSSLRTIGTTALFGFYRPFAFAFTAAQASLFGWEHPELYETLGILTHLASATLVGVLASVLGLSKRSALLAATLFILSPFSAETFYWMSGVFDRLATMLVLLTLISLCMAVQTGTSRRRRIGFAGIAATAAVGALLSKETAVVLPALVAVTLAALPERVKMLRIIACCSAVAVLVALYLVCRQRTLPLLSGAYGDWRVLYSAANVPRNLQTYALAVVRLPLPGAEAGRTIAGISAIVPGLLTAAWLWTSVRAARSRGLLVAMSFLAAIAAIAPVAWAAVVPGTSASGRFLYLPGVWLSLLPAAALPTGSSQDEGLIGRRVTELFITALLFAATVSLVQQYRVWQVATTLARLSITAMRPYAATDRALFITNLPATFSEGPYILKDYAFSCYFGPAFKPRVRSTGITVRLVGDRAWFSGSADQNSPAPGERLMTLQIPIAHPVPVPRAKITTPLSGILRQPFVLAGWAVDVAGPFGCGTDFVHVYSTPAEGPAIFVGMGNLRQPSAEAAQYWGTRYGHCGWSLTIDGLRSGQHTISVHPHDTAAGDFVAPLSVVVRVAR